jgi:glutathione synthase/RimK-type ligase-like ATP-grasp enzyme
VSAPRIALATCTAHPEGYAGDHLLTEALVRRGLRPEWVVWNDPAVEWAAYALVVLRSTWDYPDHLDRFRAWVRSPELATRLVNGPDLVLGNLHKGYLAALGELAVPTMVVAAGTTVELGNLGWRRSVVKPAVGVGGFGAVRGAGQADLDAITLAAETPVDAVVQPYLPAVERRGELSVVCVGGEPTHAVRKLPAGGEFRIHEHWGGTAELVEPSADELAVARAVLGRLPEPALYARADLIDDGDRPLVVELELVEPYLWLELAPHAADRLADELVRRAQRPE